MHISLDSELGRQRRLNQIGETISSIAAPTAAYSLRSLTGGDPRVVRVRRESDNHEQDFTASEVSSGALVDFVNSQVTPPLDIREEQADGRTGNFLIAKAAYSLRSLGTRQATVAATGDTVARANGKYVCQVRRDSDDALKSFTADEITDGTLLSFVGTSGSDNGFVKTWYDQSVTNQAGDTATGNHATQATAASQPKIVENGSLLTLSGKPTIKPDGTDDFLINESSIWDTISNSALSCFTVTEKTSLTNRILWAIGSSSNEDGDWLIGGGGTTGDVQFRGGRVVSASSSIGTSGTVLLTALDVSAGDAFINGTAIGSPSSTTPNVTADRLVLFNRRGSSSSSTFTNQALSEVIFYGDNQTDNRTAIEANIGEHYSISGIPAFDNSVNGFVETWYDQFGSRDAVQATASKQPLIVESGSLNVDSFSNPTIRFEKDSDTHFTTTDETLDPNLEVSAFVVQKDEQVANANSGWVAMRQGSFGDRSAFEMGVNNNSIKFRLIYDPGADNTNKTESEVTVDSDGLGTTSIMTGIKTSTGDLAGVFNGNIVIDTPVADNTDLGSGYGITIGKHNNSDQFADGRLNEVIFYLSDQTANRSAIETNLANHYGITLL